MIPNLSLDSQLQELYIDAIKYLNKEVFKPLTIIHNAASIYIKYEQDLPDNLKETLSKCLAYTNNDFPANFTFSEFCEEGDILIEELSGCLAEYFA